jgi:tetratricopeptide (TPR) repeat protein
VALSLCVTPARAAACEDPYLLERRESVVEPCSKALSDPTLAPSRRARFLEYRARGLRSAKRADEALRDIGAALEIAKDDPALIYVRAGLQLDRGNFGAAWNDGLRAVELAPTNPRYYQVPINIALSLHDYDTARELIEHATSLDPGNVDLMILRFFYHERRSKIPEAIAAIDEALASPRARERRAYGIDWYGRKISTDLALGLSRGTLLQRRFQWQDAATLSIDSCVKIAKRKH